MAHKFAHTLRHDWSEAHEPLVDVPDIKPDLLHDPRLVAGALGIAFGALTTVIIAKKRQGSK